jgi:hypothetical protein
LWKDKSVKKTSSPVGEIKSVESPPAPLKSVVQSLCSDKSQVVSVDQVGRTQSRWTERELGKQLDAEEIKACTDRPSSCDTSNLTHGPVNTGSGSGAGNTLVSTTDCMVWGGKVDSYTDCQEITKY